MKTSEATIPRSRYYNQSYYSRKQFDFLTSQLIEVFRLNPEKMLEIGIGNGYVSGFLKQSGIDVTTFDINEELHPDVVGDVTNIDHYFEPDSFDLILCAEVLEHLPFDNFEPTIEKLKIITSKRILITLPRRHRLLFHFIFELKLPFLKRLSSRIICRISDNKKWDGHQWEIDYQKKYSQKEIIEIMAKHLNIETTFIDPYSINHQFFLITKSDEK